MRPYWRLAGPLPQLLLTVRQFNSPVTVHSLCFRASAFFLRPRDYSTKVLQHHSTTGLDDSDAMERQRIGISCSLHFSRSTLRSIYLHRDPPESYGDPFYPPPLDIDRNSTVRPVRPSTAAYSITSSSGSLYTP